MKMNIFEILGFILRHPFAKRNRFKSCLNFIRWQIGVRIIRKKILIPWIDNAILVVGKGDIGLTGNLYTGLLEFEDMSFLLHGLRETEIFLDVGANAGAYTILASKVVRARTIAFEPIHSTFNKSIDQVNVNDIRELVTTYNMGVGAEVGELAFTNQGDTLNKVSFDSQFSCTEMIKVTTLDECADPSLSYFLKIDVEGFEYYVIMGAEKLLLSQNVLAIIIELNDNCHEFGFSNDQIHEKIVSYGYVPIEYQPEKRSINRLDYYNKTNLNTIYVRDTVEMARRCASSQARVIQTPFMAKI